MKRLPKYKRKNGFDYNLVLRGRRSCIYEQRVSEKTKRYEVFLIKIKPESVLNDKLIPEREIFPHDEAFGYWAWCCMALKDAFEMFRKLENNEAKAYD